MNTSKEPERRSRRHERHRSPSRPDSSTKVIEDGRRRDSRSRIPLRDGAGDRDASEYGMLRWEFRAVGRAKQLNGRIYGQGFDRSGPIGVALRVPGSSPRWPEAGHTRAPMTNWTGDPGATGAQRRALN